MEIQVQVLVDYSGSQHFTTVPALGQPVANNELPAIVVLPRGEFLLHVTPNDRREIFKLIVVEMSRD
jgi:hypothetical protein